MTTAARPAAKKAAPAAPKGAVGGSSAGLVKHLETLGEVDVMSPAGMYEFLEAYRQLMVGMSFFVHAGVAQMEHAIRQGARGIVDGRLTMQQKVEFIVVMRRMKRLMDGGMGELLLEGAATSVKVYKLLEDFLEGLESDSVSRPHRGASGGFSFGK